ncbi:MAG: hypothetical protein HQL14_03720 [Candidatus Omnitrophica bacterium]|nr:hypothetical protein [Candidatus Omnitrophota bacterium]
MKFTPKVIFLLLTILTAGIFVWPELNFQDLLSQGDHGRDLYAFDAVTHGKLPYKDFWWVYGPLMPYYYGLFFKIFGVHMTSVFLGRALLVIACSAFFYLSATCIMSPGLAYLAAAWFTETRQEFFFTYNHIGGITAELIILWCLLSYILKGSMRYLWIAIITGFILGLIKINFGLAALAGIGLATFCIDGFKKYSSFGQKKKFYWLTALFIPLGLGIIYWVLLKDLPLYAIRQCMPYFGDDQPYHASPLLVVPYYLTQHWLTLVHSAMSVDIALHKSLLIGLCVLIASNMTISVILHGCTLFGLYLLLSNKLEKTYRQNILLTLGVLGLSFVLYFNEFLVSGIWYRTYWSMPFLDLFHFVMISLAFKFTPKFLRILILIFLWGLAILGVVAHIGSIESQKNPGHYLNMERGGVYVNNEPQWTDTVNTVSHFLNTTLKKDDYFFALPYDCLYYYLSGHESPTRQLIYFDHIKIPRSQEIEVIKELETKKISYVIMSNRFISNEPGLGVFGKTYCPLIAQYIHDNFSPIARQGGDWTQPPGWANNHGVMIFKRKP